MTWIALPQNLLVNYENVAFVRYEGEEVVIHFTGGNKIVVEQSIGLLVWRYFDQMAETEFKLDPESDSYQRIRRGS